MASLPLLYLFLFLHLSLPSMGVSERVLLRSLGDGGRDADAAVDLNSTNFDDVLKSSITSYAIVQFFAHWIASMCKLDEGLENFITSDFMQSRGSILEIERKIDNYIIEPFDITISVLANKPGKLDDAPQYDMDVELNGLIFSVVCLLNFLTAGDEASTLVPADSCCPFCIWSLSWVKNLTM